MKFGRLIVLLPCQSLEDFSVRRDAAEANEILAAWTMAWHPVLVASAEATPGWERAASPSDNVDGCLVIVPGCAQQLLPEGWLDRARNSAACLIDDCRDRRRMLDEALARIDPPPTSVDDELAADFMALGMGHLLIELLTRQLRYMSNLDETTLQTRVVDAARAAVSGDRETADSELQRAYDVLQEGRDYFYPVSGNLIDLTLVAPGAMGEPLRAELANPGPLNLLLTGDALEEMARYEPDTLQAVRAACEAKRASIVGGEYGEAPLPLLSIEAVAAELRRGREAFVRRLGQAPVLYGRRRCGLLSLLPQALRKAGFTGAVHFTLDDGRFPTVNQSRVAWEGIDGTTIETLSRVPLDARLHDVFLRLPERLGDVWDIDHAATLVFAHWPGETSPWYRELQRLARRSSLLGTFTTLDDYLLTTCSSQTVRHPTDDYRPPYLRQDVAARRPDPISRYARCQQRRATLDAWRTLAAWTAIAGGPPADDSAERLFAEVDDSLALDLPPAADLEQRVNVIWNEQLKRLAALLTAGRSGSKGQLWFNPFSTLHRQPLPLDVAAAPGAPIELVDVPPLGYAWVGREPSAAAAPHRGAPEPPMAEGNTLRNEYFEVALSAATGGVQSLTTINVRGNRLGQQLVVRRPDYDPPPEVWLEEPYDPAASEVLMAVDEMKVVSAGPSVGEIVSRGRLLERGGGRVAGYVQTTRVRRGSRILELEIELDPDWLPFDDPWNAYYGVRFAWSDSAAELYRSSGMVHRRTELRRFEAPHFAEVRSGAIRTTFLTGGLPYHRRHDDRMLDTLLICGGETCRKFRLGVGIDLPAPAASACEWLTPPAVVADTVAPNPAALRWFRIDARNVIPTFWEPLIEEQRIIGFRVRLLETEGRETLVGLQSHRAVASARKTDVADEAAAALTIETDRIAIPMRACEWTLVECRWAAETPQS